MDFNGFGRRLRSGALAGAGALALTACAGQPLDFDLRGLNGGFSTADAATAPLADRPRPDDRGVISYPNYQVAVARRGDTLNDVASRLGTDPNELARFNGIDPKVELRRGEIIALPRRVAEPSPATGAAATGPIRPDITSLAGTAIDRAPATPGVQTAALPAAAPKPQTGTEPARHRVERGETAYTIARLYNVPVKALAEWNGLGPDFGIREGQFLLIPVARQAPPRRTPAATTAPGEGSPTPTPPSAAKPLPQDEAAVPQAEADAPAAEPVADIGRTTAPASTARMTTPVQGSIIRAYAPGTNEGIDIAAPAGTAVKAADAGTVAAVTTNTEGVAIVVIKHNDGLLTVYTFIDELAVNKNDSVSRGQTIAKVASGNPSFLHFEARRGLQSVDPTTLLP